MAITCKCTFTVSGRGIFPVDMLRYDQAWPIYPDDASKLLTDEAREIRLNSTKHVPTFDRWTSFGWTVIRDTVEYYDDERML